MGLDSSVINRTAASRAEGTRTARSGQTHNTGRSPKSHGLETHNYGVRKGTGSQSVVVCTGKYPGGKSQQQVLSGSAKAVHYVAQLLAVRGTLYSWPSCT